MKRISKAFLRGLVTIVPIALTVYIVYWLVTRAEALLKPLMIRLLTERYYLPGMGLALGIVLIVAVGIVTQSWLVRKLLKWTTRLLDRIPFVKLLYGAIRDLMSYFDGSFKKDFNQIVMVSVGDPSTRLMGMVTRTNFHDLPEGIGAENDVAVYLPMSYQMGGFTILVPRSNVRPVDMSIQEGMRFALTAGMSATKPD